MIDAVSIVGEYLKTEPWLKLLYDHLGYFVKFKSEIFNHSAKANHITPDKIIHMSGLSYRLKFVDLTMKETNMENLPTANENNMASSTSLQVCVCKNCRQEL